MQLFNKVLSQGHGLAKALVARAPHVDLSWDVRQKSRFDAIDSKGQRLGVFLPRGTVLRGGDVLVSTDGDLLRVVGDMQQVLRITAFAAHGSAFDLVRAAYHLGNRHVPIELTPTYLHIEPDHVLAAMLRAMHLIVDEVCAAFEPESGAYGDHGSHGHGHGHGHSHNGEGAHHHPHPHPHPHSPQP